MLRENACTAIAVAPPDTESAAEETAADWVGLAPTVKIAGANPGKGKTARPSPGLKPKVAKAYSEVAGSDPRFVRLMVGSMPGRALACKWSSDVGHMPNCRISSRGVRDPGVRPRHCRTRSHVRLPIPVHRLLHVHQHLLVFAVALVHEVLHELDRTTFEDAVHLWRIPFLKDATSRRVTLPTQWGAWGLSNLPSGTVTPERGILMSWGRAFLIFYGMSVPDSEKEVSGSSCIARLPPYPPPPHTYTFRTSAVVVSTLQTAR